ncbi:MAG TPA: sulfotransferase family protein, partial [Bacteroidetes bacterium]|nr:sulfotransferase family protein [Bacteroidota bacterium]
MRSDPKIICVGYMKTGTTSMRIALRELGYRTTGNNHQLLFPILKKKWNVVYAFLDNYDAIADNPWPKIYKELDQEFPGSKFILTERDAEGWYKSLDKHIGNLRNPMHEWLYGRGKGIPKHNKDSIIKTYNEHLKDVYDYFSNRPSDFLVMNFKNGDGWEKLCFFLGKPIPDVPFPYANKGEEKVKRSLKFRIRRKLKFI